MANRGEPGTGRWPPWAAVGSSRVGPLKTAGISIVRWLPFAHAVQHGAQLSDDRSSNYFVRERVPQIATDIRAAGYTNDFIVNYLLAYGLNDRNEDNLRKVIATTEWAGLSPVGHRAGDSCVLYKRRGPALANANGVGEY
jgi:hypothetical protein